MKIKNLGCAVVLYLALGTLSHAAGNTVGNVTTSATPPATQTNSGKALSPFSADSKPATSGSPVPAIIMPAPVNVTMVLNSGDLLSYGIKVWAEKSGYKLLWQSKNDYLIYNPIVLSGKDDDTVLTELGRLFASENYGLIIKNYQRNHVLVVDDM